MDHLERLFRHLVRTIRATQPQYLTQPFEAAELYQTIMPYRHHRRELGLETNLDYEMVLLELLSGARGYLVVDDRMREVLSRELKAPNPDPGKFREFSTVPVSLSREAVVAAESTPVAPSAAPATAPSPPSAPAVPAAPVAPAATTVAAPAAAPVAPPPPRTSGGAPSPMRASQALSVAPGETCRYCGGDLPPGRRIVFCPHCGQNLTVVNCLACGTELELGWKFCTTCGRPSQGAAT